jgi:hypothetical protein
MSQQQPALLMSNTNLDITIEDQMSQTEESIQKQLTSRSLRKVTVMPMSAEP